MTWRCQLTGVGPMTGNNVSHSHRATKRRFLPNLIRTRLRCETLQTDCKLRISAAALRSVDKAGGLDAFLLDANDQKLSANALRLKRAILKKRRQTARSKQNQASAQA